MPLNPVTMGTNIATAMLANPACGAQPGAATQALGLAIATGVIMSLTTEAEVHPELGTPFMSVMAPGPIPVTGLGKIV